MKLRPVSTAGNAPKVTATWVVALHDPDTGRIHHVHTVQMHEGARHVSRDEALEQAHRHARALGHDVGCLRTATSTNPDHGLLPHRVDARTGEFVAIEPAGCCS